MHPVVKSLQGGLIVSCQAPDYSPVYGPQFMAAFAKCAEMGGAVGIRANGGRDVKAIREVVRLPIIGINKLRSDAYPVYITPTPASARSVVQAGANLVAVDATHRPRRGGMSPETLIQTIQDELGVPVMADIDTLEEGIAAAQAGADIVATTMAGYTNRREKTAGVDLELIRALVAAVDVPVICEGRVGTPNDVAAAFEAGAFAVVVGTAITNPLVMTQAFAAAAKGK